MKVFFVFIILFSLSATQAQFEICSPYGAGSCETAKKLCQDEHYDFCSCPGFKLGSSLEIFYTVLIYTFDVTGPGQSVDIQIGGDWSNVTTAIVGPISFNSSCGNWTLASSNPINISQTNASIGNVALPPDPGKYYIIISGMGLKGADLCPYIDINFTPDMVCIEEPCETCIGSFAPIPSGEYLIGAWTKEENAPPSKITYTFPQVSIICDVSSSVTPVTFGPFSPQGIIIDGWQRIEEKIIIPFDATSIQLVFSSTNGNVYYDDIRMFPFDASMKTYVYDPINMRLAAELDERHYATFYEYDEEGKLIRIKKETEKGVMTIQETRSNSSK